MNLRNFGASLLAGFGATTVHVVLMWLKHRTGVLPAFEPYADMQRLLSAMIGRPLEPALSWLISYVNGALILGFVFGRLYTRLPGAGALAKGALFGLAPSPNHPRPQLSVPPSATGRERGRGALVAPARSL